MAIDKRTPRVLNSDADNKTINKVSMLDALNFYSGPNSDDFEGDFKSDGGDLILKNIKGNTLVSVHEGEALPGDARLIGSFEDAKTDLTYLFIYSEFGPDHGVWVYDRYGKLPESDGASLRLIYKSDQFNFPSNGFVKADVVYTNAIRSFEDMGVEFDKDAILYFTDNENEPRKINAYRAFLSGGSGIHAPNPFSEADFITACPKTPLAPITFSFENDPTRSASNFSRTNGFQFAYQVIYIDGFESAISPYSDVAFSPTVIGQGAKTYVDHSVYNTCVLTIPEQSPEVKKIKILARIGNQGSFFIVDEIDPVQTYNFYNDRIYKGVSKQEENKQFDNLPRKARTQTSSKNRMMYGNYLDGFDNVPVSCTTKVIYKKKPDDDGLAAEIKVTPSIAAVFRSDTSLNPEFGSGAFRSETVRPAAILDFSDTLDTYSEADSVSFSLTFSPDKNFHIYGNRKFHSTHQRGPQESFEGDSNIDAFSGIDAVNNNENPVNYLNYNETGVSPGGDSQIPGIDDVNSYGGQRGTAVSGSFHYNNSVSGIYEGDNEDVPEPISGGIFTQSFAYWDRFYTPPPNHIDATFSSGQQKAIYGTQPTDPMVIPAGSVTFSIKVQAVNQISSGGQNKLKRAFKAVFNAKNPDSILELDEILDINDNPTGFKLVDVQWRDEISWDHGLENRDLIAQSHIGQNGTTDPLAEQITAVYTPSTKVNERLGAPAGYFIVNKGTAGFRTLVSSNPGGDFPGYGSTSSVDSLEIFLGFEGVSANPVYDVHTCVHVTSGSKYQSVPLSWIVVNEEGRQQIEQDGLASWCSALGSDEVTDESFFRWPLGGASGQQHIANHYGNQFGRLTRDTDVGGPSDQVKITSFDFSFSFNLEDTQDLDLSFGNIFLTNICDGESGMAGGPARGGNNNGNAYDWFKMSNQGNVTVNPRVIPVEFVTEGNGSNLFDVVDVTPLQLNSAAEGPEDYHQLMLSTPDKFYAYEATDFYTGCGYQRYKLQSGFESEGAAGGPGEPLAINTFPYADTVSNPPISADKFASNIPYLVGSPGPVDTIFGVGFFVPALFNLQSPTEDSEDPGNLLPSSISYKNQQAVTELTAPTTITSIGNEGSTLSFKTEANHDFGVVYYDERGRHGFVNHLDTVFVEGYTDSERPGGGKGPVEIELTMTSTPPDWAHYYKIVYAPNSTVDDFIQYSSGGAFVKPSGSGNVIDADDTNIYVSLNYLQGHPISYTNSFGARGDEGDPNMYRFEQGDKLLVISYFDGEERVYTSDQFEVVDLVMLGEVDNPLSAEPTSNQQGQFLVVRNNPDSTNFSHESVFNESDKWGNNCVFEVRSPKKKVDLDEQIYYEIEKTHRVVRSAEDPDVLIHYPGTVTLTQGDVWFRKVPVNLRNYSNGNFTDLILNEEDDAPPPHTSNFKPLYLESSTANDLFAADAISIGRPNVIFEDAVETVREATITYSEVSNPESSKPKYSSFNPSLANFKDLSERYGDIEYINSHNDYIIVIQREKVSIVPVEKNLLSDGSGSSSLISSLSVLGEAIIYPGVSGCDSDPTSIYDSEDEVYFCNKSTGKVFRWTRQNGTEEISGKGMSSILRAAIKRATNEGDVRIVGGYDTLKEEYLISILNPVEKITSEEFTLLQPIEGGITPTDGLGGEDEGGDSTGFGSLPPFIQDYNEFYGDDPSFIPITESEMSKTLAIQYLKDLTGTDQEPTFRDLSSLLNHSQNPQMENFRLDLGANGNKSNDGLIRSLALKVSEYDLDKPAFSQATVQKPEPPKPPLNYTSPDFSGVAEAVDYLYEYGGLKVHDVVKLNYYMNPVLVYNVAEPFTLGLTINTQDLLEILTGFYVVSNGQDSAYNPSYQDPGGGGPYTSAQVIHWIVTEGLYEITAFQYFQIVNNVRPEVQALWAIGDQGPNADYSITILDLLTFLGVFGNDGGLTLDSQAINPAFL